MEVLVGFPSCSRAVASFGFTPVPETLKNAALTCRSFRHSNEAPFVLPEGAFSQENSRLLPGFPRKGPKTIECGPRGPRFYVLTRRPKQAPTIKEVLCGASLRVRGVWLGVVDGPPNQRLSFCLYNIAGKQCLTSHFVAFRPQGGNMSKRNSCCFGYLGF